MKLQNNAIDELCQQGELAEDEYLNAADGLIYCSKCHTPRQHRVELRGRVFLPTVPCRCQQEQYEKEEAERKRQEFLAEVSRMRSVGLQDKSLYDYTFENNMGYNAAEMFKAQVYVDHWEEMEDKAKGLLLWGDVGTGKTFIAACIANALLNKGIPVFMTNVSRIINTLTGMYSNDKNRYIDSFNNYSLLIIDDLGIERNSAFALEQVFNVIDSRYCSKKPFIVTTNLTLEELKHPTDLAKERIYSRVLERCIPLKISNQNIRKINSACDLQEAKKIFDPNI